MQGAAHTGLEISRKHRLLFETSILRALIWVCRVYHGVTHLLLGYRRGERETREVGMQKILAEISEFSLVNSLRDSRFNFSEKPSHPVLSLMMTLLAEEDIFTSVQPARSKGYEGDA